MDINREIERKFLLRDNPSKILKNLESRQVYICQGYLLSNEFGELRIRRVIQNNDVQHFVTAKEKGDLVREEWEYQMPEWLFNSLWNDTWGRRIYKIRHFICYDKYIIHVDEYLRLLNGLFTLECEFPSVEDSENFILPEWASDAVEITYNKNFKNLNLINGLPPMGA